MAPKAQLSSHLAAWAGLVCLTTSCLAHRAAPPPLAAPGQEAPGVRIEYVEPTSPAHRRLHDRLRDGHVLEDLAEVLSVLRLPRTLTLKFADCGGESNAWYLPSSATITFCYEYVEEIRQAATSAKLENVSLEEATDGPVIFVLLHEIGHAVFDLEDVPILGREEDAADTFAAVMLLRFARRTALPTLRGAAWAYAREAGAHTPGPSDFADAHGLHAQRYYNILCMAYGGDPARFADFATRGRLPLDRAATCADEYEKALAAVERLIHPTLDSASRPRAGRAGIR